MKCNIYLKNSNNNNYNIRVIIFATIYYIGIIITFTSSQSINSNGANIIDLLWARLPTTAGNHTDNIRKSKQGMKDAAKNGIKHVRFAGASYLGRNMKLWHDEKTR